ncbi:MAG TPA: HIT domain-containing protein, partial [Phycisphaerae bacterium]|nr:HIT domain-containing protein [Phycisphaerae bacterium]
MSEFQKNIWAPWRLEYVQSLAGLNAGGCFLCDYGAVPNNDAENLVLARREPAFVVFNRFPYTNGHILIAPLAHKAELDDLDDDEMRSIWWLTR